MPPPEVEAASFIVKLWLEEDEVAAPQRIHGHITHVPSGERRYLKDFDGILDFIFSHLRRMGLGFRPCWRVKHWLRSFCRY